MVKKRTKQRQDALKQLVGALELYEKESDQRPLNFLMVTKAFEVLVEASWKEFKSKVEDEGLEAPSPKEVIRKAATIGIVEHPEPWIEFISARNLSVHDYYSVEEPQFIELTRQLIALCKKE